MNNQLNQRTFNNIQTLRANQLQIMTIDQKGHKTLLGKVVREDTLSQNAINNVLNNTGS